MSLNIRCDNVLNDLSTYEDYFFNTVFCDPPYNLGSKWIIDKETGKPIIKQAQDFMNKWDAFGHDDWDKFFDESFRVLKYGGYLLMFGMDRQLFAIQYYAMKNGFEIQQSLYWYFISNFPKATDVGKVVDKRLGLEREIIRKTGQKCGVFAHSGNGTPQNIDDYETVITAPNSDIAKEFNGYKYSVAPLKQVVETIMVFKKPVEQSVIDDLMSGDEKCSPSVLNIDEGRVGIEQDDKNLRLNAKNHKHNYSDSSSLGLHTSIEKEIQNMDMGRHSSKGRYPAQLFIDEQVGDVIDKQSGELRDRGNINSEKTGGGMYGHEKFIRNKPVIGNSGGASRIVHTCNYEEEEIDLLNYNPKVSKAERNAGLDEFEEGNYSHDGRNKHIENPYQRHDSIAKNTHPTLKPIKLIKHIMTLFKLPESVNQKIYVPFAGTFSEVIGIYKSGIKEENIYVCEKEQKWIKTGVARFNFWKDKDLSVKIKKLKVFKKGTIKKLFDK